MAKHGTAHGSERDTDPTYDGMSYTEKGPAYYPGECSKGAHGENLQSAKPGAGTINLSPPNARSMGAAMTGSGLPPANGINLGIDEPMYNALPPGPVDARVAVPMPTTGEAALPPGPPCGEHDVGNPGELPPGVPVGGHGEGDRRVGSPGRGATAAGGGGQLPPGVGV